MKVEIGQHMWDVAKAQGFNLDNYSVVKPIPVYKNGESIPVAAGIFPPLPVAKKIPVVSKPLRSMIPPIPLPPPAPVAAVVVDDRAERIWKALLSVV